ncbi:MAG: YbaB/EbfC family nucleoid-associated protein [Ignavibacteria bacterium]|nr:YbaB/EbfC family nucleoid-associated protein [Ignavibacteria bacterium]
MKFDLQSLLGQAQKIQEEIQKIKNELANKTVTGESGGGMVSVTMNGANKVVSVKIAKELVNPNEVQILEDLIVAAINIASEKATELAAAEMNKATGILPNIPGFNLGL